MTGRHFAGPPDEDISAAAAIFIGHSTGFFQPSTPELVEAGERLYRVLRDWDYDDD